MLETIIQFFEELLQWIPVVLPQNAPTTVPGVSSRVPQPPAPPKPTSAPANPAVAADKVAAVIYAYNTSRSYFLLAPAYSVPAKGVIVHKITMDEANQISAAMQLAAKQYGLDLSFALACTAEESVFDPFCQNGNEGPGESNTSNDPLGYDMGEEQLKLRYLIGYQGIKTAADADAFALNVTKAVPYFCSMMADKLAQAKELIANEVSSAKADARLKESPELLATGMYNFGTTGMTTMYEAGQFPSHCQQVEDLTNYFAKALGVPSIFANLPQ